MADTTQCPRCEKVFRIDHVLMQTTNEGSGRDVTCAFCDLPMHVPNSGKNGASVDHTPRALKPFKKGK